MIQANTIDEVRDAVTSHDRIKVCAGNSKPALTDGANLSLQSLNGVLEYQPSEYTFTALAGTRISEVEDLLAQNRQYLPFDPPLAAAGATVGGTVAAGLSGSGRYRYGGVRDFLIGVTFISGDGRTVSGGGKVVKNAAGFDIPKLMVGSLGRFGVLVELTFKVFPARDASATIAIDTGDLPSAISLMNTLAVSSEDLDRLDLEPPGRLMVRISGIHDALSARIARVKRLIPPDATVDDIDDDLHYWRSVREFEWAPADHTLLKLPLTSERIERVEHSMRAIQGGVVRRYGVGGNVAWLAFPSAVSLREIESLILADNAQGLVLRGHSGPGLIGTNDQNEFEKRLLRVFDPDGRFRR